jgi:hypothetical protein
MAAKSRYASFQFKLRHSAPSVFLKYTASRLRGLPPEAGQLHWLLLATLPNSGSTAFAKLVEQCRYVSLLTRRGEGQWLLPDLRMAGKRWQADHVVDYARVRHIWSRRALADTRARDLLASECLVFEKSPPNLMRAQALQQALGGAEVAPVVSFSRDPVAICASWAKRYQPAQVAYEWLDVPKEQVPTGEAFMTLLGDLCGRRMATLATLRDMARFHISYEEFCEAGPDVVAALRATFPQLADIDPGANLVVKDYEAQPLQNLNAAQRARLSAEDLRAILRGLEPHSEAISSFGYRVA